MSVNLSIYLSVNNTVLDLQAKFNIWTWLLLLDTFTSSSWICNQVILQPISTESAWWEGAGGGGGEAMTPSPWKNNSQKRWRSWIDDTRIHRCVSLSWYTNHHISRIRFSLFLCLCQHLFTSNQDFVPLFVPL